MIKLRSLALEADISDSKFELRLLDQTLLPHQEVWLKIETNEQMIEAIKENVRLGYGRGLAVHFKDEKTGLTKTVGFSYRDMKLVEDKFAEPTGFNFPFIGLVKYSDIYGMASLRN